MALGRAGHTELPSLSSAVYLALTKALVIGMTHFTDEVQRG